MTGNGYAGRLAVRKNWSEDPDTQPKAEDTRRPGFKSQCSHPFCLPMHSMRQIRRSKLLLLASQKCVWRKRGRKLILTCALADDQAICPVYEGTESMGRPPAKRRRDAAMRRYPLASDAPGLGGITSASG